MNEQNNMVNEPQTNNCKCKKKGGLSIFLVIVALAAGVTIGYFGNNILDLNSKDDKTEEKSNEQKDKSNVSEESNTNVTQESNSNVESNNNVESNSNTTTVETKTINIVEDKNGVPYVNIKGLESINTAISKDNTKVKGYGGSLDYTYIVEDNLLVLYTECVYPSGMGADFWVNVYYIDLKTNKQLTVKDVIKKWEISEDTLIENMNTVSGVEDNEITEDLIIMPVGGYYVIMPIGMGDPLFIYGHVE